MAKTATVTFREPNHDGGALRVRIIDKYQAALGDVLEDSAVDLFEDLDGSFVGLEATEPREVPKIAERLRTLPLRSVDVPAAGLYGVHPADALMWGYEHLYPKYPSYTAAELRTRLAAIGPSDREAFFALYRDDVQSDMRVVGPEWKAFELEFAQKSDRANRR